MSPKDLVLYGQSGCCTATDADAQLPFYRGVGAVGEYESWSRHARGGLNGYASSSAAVLNEQSAPRQSEGLVATASHTDTTTRRRRVLEMLLGAIAIPALIALATGSSTAWWVFVGMLPLFGVYLAVVLYARRVRAEREINVAFFGRPGETGRGLEDVFAGSGAQLDEVSA
jgi:hypothetical protein